MSGFSSGVHSRIGTAGERAATLPLKRGVYAESGVAAYWVVDPLEPSLTAWALVDGEYVDAGHAEGDELLELTEPFAVAIRPSQLLD